MIFLRSIYGSQLEHLHCVQYSKWVYNTEVTPTQTVWEALVKDSNTCIIIIVIYTFLHTAAGRNFRGHDRLMQDSVKPGFHYPS